VGVVLMLAFECIRLNSSGRNFSGAVHSEISRQSDKGWTRVRALL